MWGTRVHSAAKSLAALMFPYHLWCNALKRRNGGKVGPERYGVLKERLSQWVMWRMWSRYMAGSKAEAACFMLKMVRPFILPWKKAEWRKKIQKPLYRPQTPKMQQGDSWSLSSQSGRLLLSNVQKARDCLGRPNLKSISRVLLGTCFQASSSLSICSSHVALPLTPLPSWHLSRALCQAFPSGQWTSPRQSSNTEPQDVWSWTLSISALQTSGDDAEAVWLRGLRAPDTFATLPFPNPQNIRLVINLQQFCTKSFFPIVLLSSAIANPQGSYYDNCCLTWEHDFPSCHVNVTLTVGHSDVQDLVIHSWSHYWVLTGCKVLF